jgi:heat shock protein HslJ
VREYDPVRPILCVALFALLLAGCAGDSNADPSGRTWRLTDLEGTPPLEGTTIDLTIDGEQVSGSSGCNTYSGPVTFDPAAGTMTLGPNLASTMMACEEPIMDQERRYLDSLVRVRSYEIVDGDLTLIDDTGTVVLTFE